MKIRKLVAASDVKACGNIEETPTICSQEDFANAIDCIQNAITILSHAVQCDNEDIVAKESIANLAVVLFDLKSAHQPAAEPESTPVEEVIEEVN